MIAAWDSSTERLSLALRSRGKIIAQRAAVLPQRHNETLLPLLASLLADAGCAPEEIQGLVVGLGPGSFTGVRVGVAAALGLAQALDKPVLGVSSFLAVAAGGEAERSLVVADARQGLWYAACYGRGSAGWTAELPEALASLPDLARLLPAGKIAVSGPGATACLAELSALRPGLYPAGEAGRLPDAGVLAALADGSIPSSLAGRLPGPGMPYAEIAPIYLQRTQAELAAGRRPGGGKDA